MSDPSTTQAGPALRALGDPEDDAFAGIGPADHARFTIRLDNDGLANLTDFALYDAVLTGDYPHGWGAHGPAAKLDALPEVEDLMGLLPAGAKMTRSITLGMTVEVIGRGDGYVVQIGRNL